MIIKDLVPCIVQDYISGKVLMFAYANQESYEYMLKNGETCFWSRSRQELWHKGETSGNIQKIKNMYWDCDNDTLLILVEQLGKGACHTGAYTCFNQEGDIFDIIANQIKTRKESPKENSYTNYLLSEGIDKVCKKIGEEATETIISIKNNDKASSIAELADLAYHLQVAMFIQGITNDDIKKELTNRHNKEENLKAKNEKGEF